MVTSDFEDNFDLEFYDIEETDERPRKSLRHKANHAKRLRCRTLIAVLENPRNLANIL